MKNLIYLIRQGVQGSVPEPSLLLKKINAEKHGARAFILLHPKTYFISFLTRVFFFPSFFCYYYFFEELT